VLVFLAMASPVIVWRVLDPVGLPLVADPAWLELLRLRSPHHVSAFTWSTIDGVATFALVAVVVACAPTAASRERSITLVSLALATLGLFAIGLVFTELFPLSPVIQLQLFRASAFLAYMAIIAYSSALVGVARGPVAASGIATLWILGFVVFFEAEGWPFGLAALAIAMAVVAAHVRLFGRAIAPEALALVLVALVAGLAFGASRANRALNTANAQTPEWLDVQRWARAATARDAVFIVPPGHDGFRVESERSIYADWKDGTQAFFNADVGHEWLERMQRLGYHRDLPVTGLTGVETLDQAFRELELKELLAIASDLALPKVYVVDFADSHRFAQEAAYQNARYAVFGISSPGDSSQTSE
jgi:hypothetical protein